MKQFRLKNHRLLCGFWLFVILSFVFKHVNNDFFVFWGYGKQVKLAASNGLSALLEIWEIKGMLFRLYVYIEYLITSFFCGDLFTLQAQVVYKLIGLVFLLSILWTAVRQIPEKYIPDNSSRTFYFLTISVLLLAGQCISHLQTEMFGVFILILATSLCLNNNKRWLAGVLIGLLFFIKTPIVLMGGSLFFVYLLLTGSSLYPAIKTFIPIAVSAILTLLGGLIFLYFFYPQELNDIYDASQYEHTMFEYFTIYSLYESGCTFLSRLPTVFLYQPAIGLACICLIIEAVRALVKRSYRTIVLYVLMLVFPVAFVMIAHCFFPYHYYLLSYPSVVIILFSGLSFSKNRILHKVMCCFMILLFSSYVYLFSAISPYNISASIEYQAKHYQNSEKVQKILAEHPSARILYLDSGFSPSIFPMPSYLRYLYPLPIQRFNEQFSNFASSSTFNIVKQQILNYDDNIIVCDWDWFFTNEHPEIKEKLEKEYMITDSIYQVEFTTEIMEKCELYKELVLTKRP